MFLKVSVIACGKVDWSSRFIWGTVLYIGCIAWTGGFVVLFRSVDILFFVGSVAWLL